MHNGKWDFRYIHSCFFCDKKVMKFLFLTILYYITQPVISYAQDSNKVSYDSTLIYKMEAGDEAEVVEPKRKLVKWNEYKGPLFSLRVGGGFLYDAATFIQDKTNVEQVGDLGFGTKLRDARILFKGRFGREKAKRPVTYSVGIMYDGVAKKLLFRETGIMVAVPRLCGNIFIGRTKEGFSMNKVMVGYAGWTMERSSWSDASIPILGDGIKWLGYLPSRKLLWNIGYFFDALNYNQGFSTYSRQVVSRIMWLPILSEKDKAVLHIGMSLRKGKVDNDTLQLRARPEAWTAPYFLDTKKLHATETFMYGGEIYYRKGPWLFGSEYWFQNVNSPENGDPVFHGGDIVATWLITGETREYNTVGGFFKGILPKKSVFEGGPGAIEAVLRFSYIDLNYGTVRGGKFWRFTPMVNWHVSDNIRLEFAYGYGQLYRFEKIGATQFFQGRIQLQL
jgi:phosphate-selective porin OprO/OprP